MRASSTSPYFLLDNSSEFLCGVTDSEFRFLHSNKLFRKQFGLQPDQVKGRPFHEVIQSFQVDKFIQARENCIKYPGKVIAIEIKSYHEQEEHWFRWEISAQADDQKRIREISFIGTDITRQKRVEQELIKQAVLFDNITDAVISTDMKLRFKSWNLSSEMLFGFPPGEALNRPLTDYMSFHTLNQSNQEALDILLKKGFWKGELVVKNKKGRVLYMQSAVSLIRDTHGEPAGMISVNRDITREKKTAEELIIKKEEFQSFMENTSALAWINDEKGTLYYINSLYKKVFGLTDKAIGKNLFTCFPETMTGGWKESDLEVLNNNTRIDRIEKGTDRDGNIVYYQVYKFPVKTLSGKKLVGGQAINITEATVSRMELQQQKDRFFSFMENSPSLGWINDEDGTLYYMNSLFKKAFDLTDDVIGKNIYQFYPESMRPGCMASDLQVLNSNAGVEVLEEGIDAVGKPIYYRVYKFPVQGANGKRLIGGQAINITNETRGKQLLEKERNQFTTFMENAPILAWMVDEQGITRYMNSMYMESSGFTTANLGKDNHELYPEAIREKARNSIQEVLSENKIITYRYSYVDEQGKTRYFDACKFPMIDLHGNRMVGGQSIEVTEMVEANERITAEKNRFESFMENAPQLAWVADSDDRLLYMNSRFSIAFGLSALNLGEKLSLHNTSDSSPEALQYNRDVLQHHKAVAFLQEWRDPAGKLHYFRTYKFPMPQSEGKMLVGAQAIDITNEVMSKQALDKMHERFEFAGKATRDVIWDWDLETNRIQRFGGSNAFFNYRDKADLMDFSNDNIHPDDADEAEASLQEAIHSDAIRWMSEFRYKCAEGEYKNVIDQAYIIRDPKGKAIRLIGSMQDVTEERRLQSEVLETERRKKQEMIIATLEAQERERKEISDELHDNVNQLLASALLFLKIVHKQPGDSNGYVGQSIDYINSAVEEIRNLSHTLNPGILKHNGLCAALNEMATGLNIPGRFEVRFETEQVDEARLPKELQLTLYRIVQENMNNVLKYAEASSVSISLSMHNEMLLLQIEDNGKGFDLEAAARGLGILNIYNRAESFGGKARIITSPGNGCLLNVEIPVDQ